jgi:predicted transposase YdaD
MLIPLEQLRESSFYQYILEEGRKEGRQQVREEARCEGAKSVLRLLLEQRFGELPDWASEKIEAAGLETLEKWCTLIIGAASLEDVLAS